MTPCANCLRVEATDEDPNANYLSYLAAPGSETGHLERPFGHFPVSKPALLNLMDGRPHTYCGRRITPEWRAVA